MNSITKGQDMFSCCFLSPLLVRDYSSRLNDKNLKSCEKILASCHTHKATVTRLSVLGSLRLAVGKLTLTSHCLSLSTWCGSRSLWLS